MAEGKRILRNRYYGSVFAEEKPVPYPPAVRRVVGIVEIVVLAVCTVGMNVMQAVVTDAHNWQI
jgi:hypothetical protein